MIIIFVVFIDQLIDYPINRTSLSAIKTAFTYRLRESVGLHVTWKQLTERDAESGSSRLSTLMIDIPGDLV